MEKIGVFITCGCFLATVFASHGESDIQEPTVMITLLVRNKAHLLRYTLALLLESTKSEATSKRLLLIFPSNLGFSGVNASSN